MAIKTYSGEAFRDSYIQHVPKADDLLKTDFGQFFIIPLEEMTRLMKLPVPPGPTWCGPLVPCRAFCSCCSFSTR